MSDLEYLLKHAPVGYDVTCARCGKVLSCLDAYVEEGDEWECPECWERCEAQERERANTATVTEVQK